MKAVFSDDDWVQLAKVMTNEIEYDPISAELMAKDQLTAFILHHMRGHQRNITAKGDFRNLFE